MPLTAYLRSAGLFTSQGTAAQVPLVGVAVDAEITGLCARVAVAHRYENREALPIEAVYVFPLDEGAAVCGFEAVVDDAVIVGEVVERDRAFERYDEAIERGDGAFLLDEHRPDVFQASIGNLPPGKAVLVRLTYVTELLADDGRVRFTLPTTIAPKYAPEEDCRGVGQPDAETLNPPVDWSVPYGLDLVVRLAMPGGITGAASPSHPVAVTLQDGQAVVTLAAAEAALDRDFVLTVDAPALRLPCAWAERSDDATAVAVGFIPTFEARTSPTEIIFVVDRSGSMQGDSIAEVRNALQLCLRSMTDGCAFNIVGFGDTCEALFPESRLYDQASLDAATRHVAQLDADLGGTELRPALEFVLMQPAKAGLRRCVMLLTDGGVTNTDRVIGLAAAHRATARIFTLGIGSAASQHLVRGVARAGGGAAEFIHPGERIEGRVLRQFARLLAPVMNDVRLEWVDGEVTSVPSEVPAVFAGQRLLAYGLVSGRMPRAARLTATLPQGVQTWEVPIVDAPSDGAVVSTLVARARIRELEESPEWTAQRGSRQRERKGSAVRQQIIDLSTRHGLLSRETSFVAVERRATPSSGEVQLRRVPIRLAHGWGGTSGVPMMAAMSVALPSLGDAFGGVGLSEDEASLQDVHLDQLQLRLSHGAPRGLDGGGVIRWASRALGPRLFGGGRPAALDSLVALQAADGAWQLTRDFAAAIAQDLRVLEASLPDAPGDRQRAWATALALVWLELFAPASQQEWQLLADKAHEWLAQQPPPAGAAWLVLARQRLTSA
ncbi:MAG: VWA domain-containing protein [Acidobacteria bacterium]|nr:VWA domain-containing protein [Acidobacteriota bacterium]